MNVMLKFDDCIWPFGITWNKVYRILLEYRVKANFGFITDLCFNGKIDLDRNIILSYFHGKTHLDGKYDKGYGSGVREFSGISIEEQNRSLLEGLKKLDSKLGYKIDCLGSASNKIDKDTLKLIRKKYRQIRYVLGRGNKGAFFGKGYRDINKYYIEFFEEPPRKDSKVCGCEEMVNWDRFKKDFFSKGNKIILQFHPNYLKSSHGRWSVKSFNEFKDLLVFLKENNCTVKFWNEMW